MTTSAPGWPGKTTDVQHADANTEKGNAPETLNLWGVSLTTTHHHHRSRKEKDRTSTAKCTTRQLGRQVR